MTKIVMRQMQRMNVADWTRLWLRDPGALRPKTKRHRRRQSELRHAVNLLKRHGWLQPCEAMRYEPSSVIALDTGRLGELLLRESRRLRAQFDPRDLVVLLGPAEAKGLFSGVNGIGLTCLTVPTLSGWKNTFAGMTIAILPWMQGALLVPREYFPVTVKEVVREETRGEREARMTQEAREAEDRRAAAACNSFMGRPA